MAVELSIDTEGFERIAEALNKLAKPASIRRLTRTAGALGKKQVVQRIVYDKRNPEGKRWPPWSPEYAKTREPQHQLLVNEGHLQNTITHKSIGMKAVVGSPMRYSSWLQRGTRRMPAREFIGLSKDNVREIEDALEQTIRTIMSERYGNA